MHPKRVFRITREELSALYNSLGTMKAVADHCGVSKRLVLNRLHEMGIPPHRPRTIENHLAEVRQMAAEGKGPSAIARAVGFNVEVVRTCLDRHGISVKAFHKGYIKTENGYIKRRIPSHPRADSKGYVHEHILVMEDALGRFLTDDETVHHADGNKAHNDGANLVLMTDTEHRRLHSSNGDAGWSLYWRKRRTRGALPSGQDSMP